MGRLEIFLFILVQGLVPKQYLVYAAICATSSYSGLSGVVKQPQDVSTNYGKNLNCIYDITVPSGYGVKLVWSSFDVKGSMPSCSSDYVEVYIGCNRETIGRYCSDNMLSSFNLPHQMYSADSCMRIKFHSDGSNEGTGFKVSYTAFSLRQRLPLTFSSTCSYMTSKSNKADVIHSPNWPLGYKRIRIDSDCHWKVKVGDNRGIKIAFMDFDLKYDNGCGDDKVKVKGGKESKSYDRSDTVWGSACGKKKPFYFSSTKDQIYVRFKSEYSSSSSSYRGFMMGYVVYKEVWTRGGHGSGTNFTTIIVLPIIAALVLLGCCCFCFYRRRQMRQSHGQAHTQIAYQATPSQQVQQPYPVSGTKHIAPPPAASYGPTPGAGYPYPPLQGQAAPMPGKESYPPPPSYPAAQSGPAPPAYPAGGYPQPPPVQPYPPPAAGVDAPPYPASAPPYAGGPAFQGDAPPYPTGAPAPGNIAPYPTGPPSSGAPYPSAPSAPPP